MEGRHHCGVGGPAAGASRAGEAVRPARALIRAARALIRAAPTRMRAARGLMRVACALMIAAPALTAVADPDAPPDPGPAAAAPPEGPAPGPRRPPSLTWVQLPAEQVSAGIPVPLAVAAEGLPQGVRVQVRFRPTGAPHWAERPFTAEGGSVWTAMLPAFPAEPGEPPRRVELYVEALDGEGARIATLGGPASPASFTVRPLPAAARAAPVWYANPWVWTGAAMVVGGTVGTVLLLTDAPHEGRLPVRVRVP